jgi:hypothetical protein
MPYTEQQVDRTFAQLGLGSGYGSAYGTGYQSSRAYGAGYGTGYGQQVPTQFKQHLSTDPAALDQYGFWQHLWWGVTSPVTGTLHKLDPDRFSQFETQDPHNVSTMVGRLAGSIVGWGALFAGLALPVIGAPLTVAASGVAAGAVAVGKAVGIGVGAKLAGAIGTGVVTGAIAASHQAWLDDKDIAPEMLKGMAFGAVMAGVGYGVGRAAYKMGWTRPETYKLMQQELLKKHPMLLMNDPTDESMGLIMSSTRAKRGAIESMLVRQAKPVTIDIGDDIYRGFTKNQKALVDTMKSAKTFGEQYDAMAKLEDMVTKGFTAFKKSKGIDNIWGLIDDGASNQTVMKYQQRFEAVQLLKQAKSDHFRGVLKGTVDLPGMEAAIFDIGDEAFWKGIQQHIKTTGIDDADFFWHPKLAEAFAKYTERTNKGWSSINKKFWPPELKAEIASITAQLKKSGQAVKFYRYGETAFPIPENIPKTGLATWIGKQTSLPKEAGYAPVNFAEAWAVSKDVNWLSKNFFPLRYALGKSTSDQLRVASRSHQIYYDKTAATPIKKWMETLGVSGGKEARRQGEIIGRVGLELDFEPSFNNKFKQAANSIRNLTGKKLKGVDVDDVAIKSAARELGLPKKVILRARDHFLQRAELNNHGASKNLSFEEYLQRMGSSPDDYIATWLKQYKLYYSSGTPTAAAAKQLGFENPKQMKVAYQMRRAFDKLFEEAGFDALDYQVGYMPHFRNSDGRGYAHLLKTFKQVGMTEKQASKLLWMNQMHREVPTGSYTYETDAFKAFSRYVSGFSKQKHFEATFENINDYMKKANFSQSRIEVWNNVQKHLKGVPTQMEQDMDKMIKGFGNALNWKGWNEAWGPKPSREMMSVLAELQVMGGLGFNPFTAAKNLTQKVLAFSSITDDGNPLHGMTWFLKAQAMKRTEAGKRLLSYNKIRDHRMFHESFGVVDDSISAVARRLGVADPLLDAGAKVRRASTAMFKATDMSNVDDTFLAKLLYMQSQGAPITTAINVAHQTTMATQFMYGFDSPMFYKSTGPLGPVGRAVGVFTSWPLNWAHLMYTQGTAGEAQRAVASVVSMAVAAEVLGLTKFSFNSIHPAETAKGILPIAALEGEQKLPMLLRSAATAAGAFRAFREGDFATVDQAISNFRQRMWLLVPSGTMVKRTLDIIDIAQAEWRKTQETGQRMFAEGWDTTADIMDNQGRLKHQITMGEAARSLIGPTIEQQMRFEDWKRVSEIDYAYKHMRRKALDSFLDGDFEKFQYLQEQLVINFGRWIEPKDVKYEMELRGMTARERQMQVLPTSIKEPLLERLELRQTGRLSHMLNR